MGASRENIHESEALIIRLTMLFGAMADSTRARLLLLLLDGEKRSGDMADALNMSASAVSHQLRWLRENDIVASRKEGREVFYALADACIMDIIQVALSHILEAES
jgi:ArsR family transcriptional regulator